MKTSTNQIRSVYLDYFAKNDHQIIPSSPLVPQNDPTLLFTNAGMVQFKNLFTGIEKATYSRATSSQKCVRAGGKHNDLENVGYTARHHTFFEMLGNFSFGDYFKEHAIELAWNLITREFGINKNRLLVTIYHEDNSAFELWKKIAGLSEGQIIPISSSDNFWSMGETGPCGPCSEIFYDHGPEFEGRPPGSSNEDGDRFIEIWNLVFMQYNQLSSEKREPLPSPSIDTGMGLERIAAILQGVHDNYDTDTLRALVETSAKEANIEPDGEYRNSNRVIADHIRATSFLIADGVLPSNEGRGYVLRRIMRRAMRHAHMVGSKDAMLHKLIPVLVEEMGTAFPELGRAEVLITETIELEESRFKQMLDRGLKLLEDETNKLGTGEGLPGHVAFRLYDTYGFPIDLTQDVLRGQGRSVDITGFQNAMEKQRSEARKSWSGSGEATQEVVWFDIRERNGSTEFLGYRTEKAEGKVIALIQDGNQVKKASAGEKVALLTNQTPFYGEAGGQQGDHGIISANGLKIFIYDTKKQLGDLYVHIGLIKNGSVSVGDSVTLEVDAERRAGLCRHHSATHLLHAALREHLGKHITQKGSLVSCDRLRFDVSHPNPITSSDIELISTKVNREIERNTLVSTRLMTPESAIESGAMALFGEKYGDEVRVVTMNGADQQAYSVELCGGTHVSSTGDIGLFKITSESAVASGIRRIEAVTGLATLNWIKNMEDVIKKTSEFLNVSAVQMPNRVESLLEERRKLIVEVEELRRRVATGGRSEVDEREIRNVNGVRIFSKIFNNLPAKELKSYADTLKEKLKTGVVIICGINEGKASVVVAVTPDLIPDLNAVNLVRIGSDILGGKGGGGRPDMAQAGGPNVNKVDEVIAAIEKELSYQN